jgi:type I restriction enzyme S subunit
MNRSPTKFGTDRLKDVATINGRSLPADTDPDYEFDYLEISNVDYYGIIDPNSIERMRYEDSPSRARRRVFQGSTLISSVRPNLQGNAFVSDNRKDFICSTGFNVIQPNAAKLVPRFAYFALISDDARQYFEAAAKGVGYPAVDDKEFGSYSIPLPPLHEQQRIVAYLDHSCAAIDGAVTAKRSQIESLEELRRNQIEHAVTMGIYPNSNLHRIGQDWIEEIPGHWEVCRIKRVLSRVDYGISEGTEREGRFSVLKMGNIQDGNVDLSEIEYVDEIENGLLLESGDLLYNRTNSPDQVAKAAVFRGSRDDRITFASYLVRLRVSHRADPFFLNYVVNSTGFLAFARKLAIPSVQQSNLNPTRYCRILIPLPPIDEQRAIVTHLDQKMAELNEVVFRIEKQIKTLLAYRKSLIYECVTGQRRVTESELNPIHVHA